MSNNFWNLLRLKLKKEYSLEEIHKINHAYKWMCNLHRGQTRRSGELYLIHPIAVADIILEWNGDISMIIAALLHDVLEDSEITIEEVEKEFGAEVALHVFAVTNNTLSKNLAEKMTALLKKSPNSLLIKLADRLHNMRTIKYMPQKKQVQKANETLSTYLLIARHLRMYAVADELKKLCYEVVDKHASFSTPPSQSLQSIPKIADADDSGGSKIPDETGNQS